MAGRCRRIDGRSFLPSPRWGEWSGVRGYSLAGSCPSPPAPLPSGERGEVVLSRKRRERIGAPSPHSLLDHAEAAVLRRGLRLALGVRGGVGAAAGHAALTVLRRHPLRHV